MADDRERARVDEATALVRRWVADARASEHRRERRDGERLHALTSDASSTRFAMAFADRVVRPSDARVAAAQLRALTVGPLPGFLGPLDRVALRVAGPASLVAPRPVMALARRRLRDVVGPLVADRRDDLLADHLEGLRGSGFTVNANLLGELVLGHTEADRRRDATIELLRRPDVSYVSVKASAVTAQLQLWSHGATVARIRDALRPILSAAAQRRPAAFVNLDMEEYKDVRLTIDAFTGLLDEPELVELEAGIVLQAYLPDSLGALDELTAWAQRRRSAGGAGIKVRVVKGANLAMERVDAAMHGWVQAPYATKAETDANFLGLLDRAMRSDRVDAVRLGVGSHHLFHVAWALLLARERGVDERVELEMLQGMAPALARTVRHDAGGLLLYTPVVEARDFESALAYLFRRLEENAGSEHFLRHVHELDRADVFDAERERFEHAVATRHDVSHAPRRRAPDRPPDTTAFANAPDTDPTDGAARERLVRAVASWQPPAIGPGASADAVREAVERCASALAGWAALGGEGRRAVLERAADELEARRPALVAVMVHEAAKTIGEADTEVSEAVDAARWAGLLAVDPEVRDGLRGRPLGVVAVVPPWNFPVAIPLLGTCAALAAGNTVVLKPAPQTPGCARVAVEALWAAGVPADVLAFVHGDDDVTGTALVSDHRVAGIVLTGSSETAELIAGLAPGTPLFAETSGKNAVVVMPDADLDLAVTDLVRSAFGHAGQKCSAASLAILVGDVATSERFRRQLVDATRSLAVGPADDPATAMGPLVGPPPDKLRLALTELEPGQRWLVQPERLDPTRELWSPGIVDGVRAGSWFHRTECFGPVLGLMAARDLDHALELQDGTAFGLTGGIHTLDDATARRWVDRAQVGNAYVNRPITGAIVRRQPFGGWKASVVGPGAKAGGPNAVIQLQRWEDDGLPALGADPITAVRAVEDAFAPHLDDTARSWLSAAVRSDEHWWATHVGVDHDPTGLFCESNVFRYRPLDGLDVRVGTGASARDVARVLAALARCEVHAQLSVAPSLAATPWPLAGLADAPRVEDDATWWSRVAASAPARVRVLGEAEMPTGAVRVATFVDDRPPVASGRVELLRYVREQSVSRTLHRFGNLVAADGQAGRQDGISSSSSRAR